MLGEDGVRSASVLIACACLLACGPDSAARGGGTAATLSSALSAACDGAIFLTSEQRFENIGVTALIHACAVDNGLPSFAVSDKVTGAPVDLEDLERQDAFAFHMTGAGMRSAFRHGLESSPAAKYDVQIWFRIDMTDETPKEDSIGTSFEQSDSAARDERTSAEAQKLRKKLQQIQGLELDPGAIEKGPAPYGAPYIVARGAQAALEAAGSLPEVWQVMHVTPIDQVTPTSTDYFWTTNDNWLDVGGYDGTGKIVADLEFVRPDSYLNLTLPSGSCSPEPGYGSPRLCHCAAGVKDAHARLTQGVVRSSALSFGGMADEATTISANFDGQCAPNGPDAFSSAVNWAATQGARVMYLVDSFGPDPFVDAYQTSRECLLDYKSSTYPYPLFAKSAGNAGTNGVAEGRLRNGISVGGGEEFGGSNRDSVQMFTKTSRLNPNGPDGFEVPHLAAIGEHVTTAGKELGQTDETGGTSIAAPLVAGIVAALHEMNGALQNWPEVVVPGLIATADEDLDGTVLNLHDGIDDWDGAGLVNAAFAGGVLGSSSKRNGGNPSAAQGHDYGSIAASTTPVFTQYAETYNASVASGRFLRVAALLQSRPTCPNNPGCAGNFAGCTSATVCSANPYVIFALQVWDGSTLVGMAFNASTSYQFVRVFNSSGATKNYNIRIMPLNYNGLAWTTWGLAWGEALE